MEMLICPKEKYLNRHKSKSNKHLIRAIHLIKLNKYLSHLNSYKFNIQISFYKQILSMKDKKYKKKYSQLFLSN